MTRLPESRNGRQRCGMGRLWSLPMPRYRYAESRPIDHLEDGETWPYGRLEEEAPLEAVHARAVGQRLHEAMQGRTNKKVAARGGHNREHPRQAHPRARLGSAPHTHPARTSPRHEPLVREGSP